MIKIAPLLLLFFGGAFLAFTARPRLRPVSFTADTIPPQLFRAKDHKASNVSATAGLITLTTGLSNDFYLQDSTSGIGYLYVETRIGKTAKTQFRRAPLNISIVIDRSGSMEGIKMGYAKRAAKGIIDRLQPEDIVSVVMYDNYVDTVQSPVHVVDGQKIKTRIDRIIPRGSTNLWGGSEQGYRYVQQNYQTGYINRVLLISDGRANTGLTDSALIHLKVRQYKDDNGITLSTFGVGLDYNETLMTDMAETGAGNYYYIDAPEKLTAIFDHELSGLLNVAVQDAELKITLPQGASILSGYPLQYRQEGNELTVRLRDLSSLEEKSVLFAFRVHNPAKKPLKFICSLSYRDLTDGRQNTISNENMLSPTKSAETYLTHFNKPVIEQTILYAANERLESAMNLMEKGEYATAGRYLAENSVYLNANSGYVKGNELLRKTDSLNAHYRSQYLGALSISQDSVKKVQKANKAANYMLRSKKQ